MGGTSVEDMEEALVIRRSIRDRIEALLREKRRQ
jgi:hypothetical protein